MAICMLQVAEVDNYVLGLPSRGAEGQELQMQQLLARTARVSNQGSFVEVLSHANATMLPDSKLNCERSRLDAKQLGLCTSMLL